MKYTSHHLIFCLQWDFASYISCILQDISQSRGGANSFVPPKVDESTLGILENPGLIHWWFDYAMMWQKYWYKHLYFPLPKAMVYIMYITNFIINFRCITNFRIIIVKYITASNWLRNFFNFSTPFLWLWFWFVECFQLFFKHASRDFFQEWMN
jgi:hypothetical protein